MAIVCQQSEVIQFAVEPHTMFSELQNAARNSQFPDRKIEKILSPGDTLRESKIIGPIGVDFQIDYRFNKFKADKLWNAQKTSKSQPGLNPLNGQQRPTESNSASLNRQLVDFNPGRKETYLDATY